MGDPQPPHTTALLVVARTQNHPSPATTSLSTTCFRPYWHLSFLASPWGCPALTPTPETLKLAISVTCHRTCRGVISRPSKSSNPHAAPGRQGPIPSAISHSFSTLSRGSLTGIPKLLTRATT